MFFDLLNTNASISELQPCYDDDNNEHYCGSDNPVVMYGVASGFALTVLFGISIGAYYIYKDCCIRDTSLTEPLILAETV